MESGEIGLMDFGDQSRLAGHCQGELQAHMKKYNIVKM